LPQYVQAVQINPGHVQALNNMGNIYFRGGYLAQAEAAYSQIIEKDTEYTAAVAALGQVYLSQQRTDEAITMLNRALALEESWLGAHQALTEAYKRQGQIAKSEDHKRIANELIASRKKEE
jgi:protein O-GlcNAc transferase